MTDEVKTHMNTPKVFISPSFISTAAICALLWLSINSGAYAENVLSASASPNPFDPAIQTTTISYNLNQSALLWLSIVDQSSNLQRRLVAPSSFTSTNRGASGNGEVWDGRDDSGAVLPDGTYPYNIDNAFFGAHYASPGSNPHDIAVDPSNPNIIWMTNKTNPYVYKSTNGGSSWSGVSGTGSSAKNYGIVVSADGQTLYITDDGQSSLNKSTNGGNSWTTTASFPGGATKVSDVAISDDGSIVYVLNYETSQVYKSTNSGSSWSSCGGLSASEPRGIATDANGNVVIVASSGNNRIYKSTNGCSSFGQLVSSGLNYPYQVAIQADGKFWVSERGNHRIQQFDANGNSVMVYGGTASGNGNYQFNSSDFYFGIGLGTVGGQDYVFVSDYGNRRLKQVGYDNWTSTTHLQLGAGGSADNGTITGSAAAAASGSTTIAVSMPYSGDQDGDNTYTVEYKLSSAGNWTSWVTNAAHTTSPYTTNITGLTPGASYDVRMTYDDADGVNGTNPQVVSAIVVTPSNVNTTTAGNAAVGTAGLTSIAVSMPYSDDDNGNNTYTVQYRLSSSGSWLNWVTNATHTGSPYTTTITGLNPGGTYDVRVTYNDNDGVTGTNPQTLTNIALPAVETGNVGSVFAVPNPLNASSGETTTISYDLGQSALLWLRIIDQSNTVQRRLVTPGSFNSTNRFAGTNDETWDGRNNSGAVLPDGIYPYTLDAAFFSTHYQSPGSNPQDIAVNPANPNVIWMTNKTSPYIFKSTNGGSNWSGVSGTGADAKAYGIAISSNGQRIFISNDGKNDLIVSTNGGTFWGRSGSFPGSNSTKISDVTSSADGDIVYVLDYGQRRVYRSTNAGNSWSTCSASGLSLSDQARGIATDPDGTTVIVSDSANNRLYKSTNSCASFSQITGIGGGSGAGSVSGPYQVAIQADGKFWVSERTNNRIQQFDPNGNSLIVYGGTQEGSGSYQFNAGGDRFYFGIGLATIDGQAYILVADYENTRVKKVGYDNWSSANHLQISSGTNNITMAGNASALPLSATSILVSMPYGGDDDGNNTYSVDYKRSSSTSWISWVPNPPHTPSPYTTTITGLTPGATYDVRATYSDPDGVNGANPQIISNITLPAVGPLDPPAGLSATDTPADQGESITLSWNVSPSPGVIEQRIYRSETTPDDFILVHTVAGNTTNTYEDHSVELGFTYHYVIRAFDDVQESGDSNSGSATVLDNLPPPAPTGLQAFAGNGEVAVSWTPSTVYDAIDTLIYRSTSSGSGYALLATVSGFDTLFIDNTATNGTRYYYVVRAFDDTFESVDSNESSATPLASLVNTPAGLSVIAGEEQVALSWIPSSSTDVTEQRIYRSTTSGSGYGLVAAINDNTTTSYLDTTVTNDTTYYYVVVAFNGSLESAIVTEASATPRDNIPPTALTGSLSVLKDSIANGGLTAIDSDNDPLIFNIVSNGSKGTATITSASAGTFRYIPQAGATGSDSFTFKVNDGRVDSNVATITITISTEISTATVNKGWNMFSIPTSLSSTNDFFSLLSDDMAAPVVYSFTGQRLLDDGGRERNGYRRSI